MNKHQEICCSSAYFIKITQVISYGWCMMLLSHSLHTMMVWEYEEQN